MSLPTGVLRAASDPELRPKDLHVYVFLHDHLDYLTFRPIKLTWVSHHVQLAQTNVSGALARLRQQGYIERQNGRGIHSVAGYRITLSPKE